MLCGIEIHQRILGRKLFCGCQSPQAQAADAQLQYASQAEEGANSLPAAAHPVGCRAESFSRRLHSVRSELGETDFAASAESARGRQFHYHAPCSNSCLVEADEEPPHPINQDALFAVLVFCELLSSRPVDAVCIMRKNVIDGSNTSGFQRTAIIGMGGQVQTPSGPLGIQTVCIEEESAGIQGGGKEGKTSYDLSRLGIPLVEIATAPTLGSGKMAQEAALAIGTLLRKTGLVQRGIGTIRQDLNVSVEGGARVEIKGVQDLSAIGKFVELEVQRQNALISLSAEVSKALAGRPIEQKFVDLTDVFSGTGSHLVSKMLKGGARLFGVLLPGMAGLLGRELVPGRRFGTELADYARATGVRGLIHSDEDMSKYGFSDDELSETKVALSLSSSDAFVFVAGEQKKAQAALFEVVRRAGFFGVPEETRRANTDGTSSYMRPLPGHARMYPETDLVPVGITPEMIASAKKRVRELSQADEKKESLLAGVNPELAAQLSIVRGVISHNLGFQSQFPSPELAAFAAASEAGIDRKFAASTITNTLQSLKREGVNTLALDEPRLLSAFRACAKGTFAKSAMQEILREMCRSPESGPKDAASSLSLQKITGAALEKLILQEKLDLKGLMAKYRLRVDSAEAQGMLPKA